MKKLLMFFMSVLLLSLSSGVYAATVNVQLNGSNIDFTDANGARVDAQIINSRTMVPMRKIFELLNASVDWEQATRTVTATKNDIIIKLQIENEIAEITKAGQTEKIKLDSKPVIVDGRTLVPLRFISESLGKQVGWDSANSTAIIIDYDYFLNQIKEKSPLLYELIVSSPSTTNLTISKTYTDLITQTSETSKVTANATKLSPNSSLIKLAFSGNSELFREIVSEGWGDVDLNITYNQDDVNYSTTNPVLAKMFSKNQETYKELNLIGNANESFSDMIKEYFNISEKSLNISTFPSIKSDFDKLLNLFKFSNDGNTSTIKSNSINNSNSKLAHVDFTDFDNIIFNNEAIKLYNISNKLIFNYDVKLEELLYDYSSINISISIIKSNGAITANANIELKNDYDEKVTYSMILN